MDDTPRKIDCGRCRHYYVTWDPALPRGCHAFGIRCQAPPSLVVLRSSGAPCRGFEARPERRLPERAPGRSQVDR